MKRLCAAASALLLAACAGPGFVLPARDLKFEFTGRIAAKYRDDAATGNIAWRHGDASDELLITSPVGQGIVRIVRDGAGIILTTADAKEYRSTDAESITEQVLGFRLPVAGLSEWVRARRASAPAPAPTLERRDSAGRLSELEQSGWKIEYQAYAGELPTRLRLSYPGVDLRIAISEWK